MQRGVAKGLKVPCLFMITEVSIRCQKNPEVGIRRIPAYTPQYTTDYWQIAILHLQVHTGAVGRTLQERLYTTKMQHPCKIIDH